MIRQYAEQLTRWGVKVIDQPLDEQMTLEEAKLHLRVDDDGGSPPAHPDDELIAVLISAAREWCEAYAGLSLAPKTLEIGGSGFGPQYWADGCYTYGCWTFNSQQMTSSIELPFGPVNYVSSVTYIDGDGIEQTLASSDYVLDTYNRVARLYTSYGGMWPASQLQPNAVKIRYIAGFDLVGESPIVNPLPSSVLAAMKLVLGHLYENREQTAVVNNMMMIPLGAQALLDSFRVRTGIA
jgi:uncharacterized phiE125 gp8 family phage protein